MEKGNHNDKYLTRATLLRKIRENENDQVAWGEFHEFYFGMVKNWARKRGFTSEEAEDIYQLVMMRMIKNIKKYDSDKKPFRSYLYTFTDRVCKTEYAKKVKHSHLELDLNRYDIPTCDERYEMEEAWIRQIIMTAMRATFKRVGHTKYKSFCMRTLDDMPATEVAEKLGIDRVDTVHMHQTSFRKMLKEEFFRVLRNSEDADDYTMRSVDPLLEKGLKALITNQPDYRNTIIDPDAPPSELVDRIGFVRGIESIEPVPAGGNRALLVTLNTNYQESESRKTVSSWDVQIIPPWREVGDSLTIGRESDCDVTLSNSNISGLHATIMRVEDRFILKDENSTNGFIYNNKKFGGRNSDNNESIPLKSGDVIQIFGYFLIFV